MYKLKKHLVENTQKMFLTWLDLYIKVGFIIKNEIGIENVDKDIDIQYWENVKLYNIMAFRSISEIDKIIDNLESEEKIEKANEIVIQHIKMSENMIGNVSIEKYDTIANYLTNSYNQIIFLFKEIEKNKDPN